MSFETILVDHLTGENDGIVVITLNRPDRMNAWTSQMNRDLYQAVTDCNNNSDVNVMIVTGAGRGFCAGADIRDNFQARLSEDESGGGESTEQAERQEPPGDWVGLIRSSKPMIAAVNGASVGVGATMILPFDVIIASEQAKFGMFFIKMGVVPELASSHFLVQRMGFGRASEACLTGQLYSGEEAFNNGLADKLVAHNKLMDEATALARTIAANPGPQLRQVKELLTQNGADSDIKAVQRREGEALAKAYVSPEHKEAVSAFLEKRAPNFKDLPR